MSISTIFPNESHAKEESCPQGEQHPKSDIESNDDQPLLKKRKKTTTSSDVATSTATKRQKVPRVTELSEVMKEWDLIIEEDMSFATKNNTTARNRSILKNDVSIVPKVASGRRKYG